ncbi:MULTISPECIES: hypothetical protein [unclassified Dolichospermum]|nr:MULTISPECIES: hypothetical protein [unclassified Dolichospermum]
MSLVRLFDRVDKLVSVLPVISDTEDAVFITPGLIWWDWLLWYIGCLRG